MKFLLALLFTVLVYADELPKEMAMPINTGNDNITLTLEQCQIVNEMEYVYEAKVTIENKPYKACWRKDGLIVNVWFYAQPQIFIASYHEIYFEPKK